MKHRKERIRFKNYAKLERKCSTINRRKERLWNQLQNYQLIYQYQRSEPYEGKKLLAIFTKTTQVSADFEKSRTFLIDLCNFKSF